MCTEAAIRVHRSSNRRAQKQVSELGSEQFLRLTGFFLPGECRSVGGGGEMRGWGGVRIGSGEDKSDFSVPPWTRQTEKQRRRAWNTGPDSNKFLG